MEIGVKERTLIGTSHGGDGRRREAIWVGFVGKSEIVDDDDEDEEKQNTDIKYGYATLYVVYIFFHVY
jgi:trehalose-6-phosphate synthase